MTDKKEKQPLRRKDKLQIAALTTLLVVFPAVSWYYLDQGLHFYKTAKAELKDHGLLPAREWLNYNGGVRTTDDMKGIFVLTSIYSLSDMPLSDDFGKQLSRLHNQFDDRRDVIFLSVIGEEDTNLLPAFIEKYELGDTAQCYFIRATEAERQTLIQEGLRLPAGENGSSAYFALADTASMIRNYYDVRDEAQLKRMVQHATLLLPMAKSRDELRFRREKEK